MESNVNRLTLAVILVVSSYALAIVNERPLRVEVGGRPVRQSFVVQVEELTVVGGPLRRAPVQEGAAQEFVLDLAGQLARRLARNLQLLVNVVMQARVLSHLVVSDADAWHLENTVAFARLRACGQKTKLKIDYGSKAKGKRSHHARVATSP